MCILVEDAMSKLNQIGMLFIQVDLGPLIPKNPFIADRMIKTAIKNKYGEDIQLTKLDDSLADRARATMLDRLGVKD
jgi:CobQ-like glutamine amidotransferase family enzyme